MNAGLTHLINGWSKCRKNTRLKNASYIYIYTHTQWNLGSRTPLFTNNSVYEQIFRAKRLGWRTVSRITNAQAGNSGKLRVSSVSCWLTNLVSVYEHFGSRTFRFTNGLQERIKFVNRGSTVYIYSCLPFLFKTISCVTYIHVVGKWDLNPIYIYKFRISFLALYWSEEVLTEKPKL
jgi:hypothetical protein